MKMPFWEAHAEIPEITQCVSLPRVAIRRRSDATERRPQSSWTPQARADLTKTLTSRVPHATHAGFSTIRMGLSKLKIENVDVSGKRVLIRVDFNVPQDKKDPTIITNTQR